MKNKFFFGIHANISSSTIKILMLLPFLIVLILYGVISEKRNTVNENEKITPTYSKILSTAKEYTFDKKENIFNPFVDQKKLRLKMNEARNNCEIENIKNIKNKKDLKDYCKNNVYTESRLYQDIKASMFRLLIGIIIASIIGFFIGLNLGLLKILEGTFLPFITFLSIIPPLALLPMFMITIGTGELVKIVIIVVGLVFFFIRDMYQTTKSYPKELFIKSLTLGATQFELIYKIIAPQIIPVLINSIRINLGAAWLFLIASEAMSAESGLGYTIYVVKRYMSMDVIIFYVIVITVIGFLIDQILKKTNEYFFPWYTKSKGGK